MGSFPEILLFDLYILFSLLPSFCHQYWWMKSFLDNSCVALSIGIILNMPLFWNIPQHENRTIKLRGSPTPPKGAATVHLVKRNLVPVNAKELIQCERIYTRVASCSSVFFSSVVGYKLDRLISKYLYQLILNYFWWYTKFFRKTILSGANYVMFWT